MARLLLGSIELSKIDMQRKFVTEDGKEKIGIAVWLNDEPDDHGNHASIQQSTKQGEKKIYLGNLKYFKQS